MLRQATTPPDSRGTPPVPRSVTGRIRRELSYYRALLADPRTPRSARWLIGGGLAYALLPFDLLPDFIPFIGKLDDILIASAMIGLGMRLVPQRVKNDDRYRTRPVYFGADRRQASCTAVNYQALPAPFGVRIQADEIAAKTFGPIGMLSLDLTFRHRLVVIGNPEQAIDPFDDHRLESRMEIETGRCGTQTRIDIGYRPLPLIAAVSYCMSIAESPRTFFDLEAAYAALPAPLSRQIASLQLRRELQPAMCIEAVLADGNRSASEHTHRVTGAQFLGLLFDPDIELVGLSSGRARRVRGNVFDFINQQQFRYTHEASEGRIISWDPRRVQQLSTGITVDAQRYVYPERVFARVLR